MCNIRAANHNTKLTQSGLNHYIRNQNDGIDLNQIFPFVQFNPNVVAFARILALLAGSFAKIASALAKASFAAG